MNATHFREMLENFRQLEIGNPSDTLKLRTCVDKITDDTTRRIIKRKYFDCKTVPYIMTEVFYCYEWIYKLIRRGINEAVEIWNDIYGDE